MGMIAFSKNQFVGKDCPINTYGAAGKVYGWAAAPCKPCPRNMITDGLTKVNNSDVCINDDGFGYASEGEHMQIGHALSDSTQSWLCAKLVCVLC